MSTMSLVYDGSGRYRPRPKGYAHFYRNTIVILSLIAVVLMVLGLGLYGVLERLSERLFGTRS